MTYLKDEHYINTFIIGELQYVTAHVPLLYKSWFNYSSPRCFTVYQNTKGKYIKANIIIKEGDYKNTNVLYLTEQQLKIIQ